MARDDDTLVAKIVFVDRKRFLGELFYSIISNDGPKRLFIEDIRPHKRHNQGIGSEALNYLEEIARGVNACYISGDISSVDSGDHMN